MMSQTLLKFEPPCLVTSHRPPGASQPLLDRIAPPQERTARGKLWVQRVCCLPATGADTVALKQRLDTELLQRRARETGLCPDRSGLYAEAFDEIIRQVAVANAERGLLLLRVRDELRMTVAAYQTVYESSIAYGMRRALRAERQKQAMVREAAGLASAVEALRAEAGRLEAECDRLQAEGAEGRAAALERHEQMLGDLRRTNELRTAELEKIFAPKKG